MRLIECVDIRRETCGVQSVRTLPRIFEPIGFIQNKSTPCIFHNMENHIWVVIHGGEYVANGPNATSKWMTDEMQKTYKCEIQCLGPDKQYDKHTEIFNKIITWQKNHEETMATFEADPKHSQINNGKTIVK